MSKSVFTAESVLLAYQIIVYYQFNTDISRLNSGLVEMAKVKIESKVLKQHKRLMNSQNTKFPVLRAFFMLYKIKTTALSYFEKLLTSKKDHGFSRCRKIKLIIRDYWCL